MTLLAPLFFYVALGVAAATAVLHLIVTRQPTSSPLPTARFVPRGSVRVVTFSRPQDLLLLLLRLLVVLLIGLAFARPVIVPERRPVARVVLADVSRAVGEVQEVRDSTLALLGSGDVLITFDSEARVIRGAASDSAARLTRTERPGRLSAALVAAQRAAAGLREEADSIEIAIVSPVRAGQIDGATQAIRDLWPGRIRLVPVSARTDSLSAPAGVQVVGAAEDDGVALAAAIAGLTGAGEGGSGEVNGKSGVRLVRGPATPEDSAWATAGRRTLVRWPAEGAPAGWRERERVDTAGAVLAGEAALVYPLERRWTWGAAEGASQTASESTSSTTEPSTTEPSTTEPSTTEPSTTGGDLTPVRVIARWVDGEAAAVERIVGEGCVRDVAIPVPERGDVVLRPAFGRLVGALTAPCRAAAAGVSADTTVLAALAGEGPLAPREAIERPEQVASPLVPWLLAAALALALLELWARRRSRLRTARREDMDEPEPAGEAEQARGVAAAASGVASGREGV